MELTVIGRAGGVGRVGEACSGYLVQEGQTRVLLDCGAGVASSLQRVCALEELDHVVISHWHPDHASDAGVLVHGRIIQRILGTATNTLHFYAPASTPDLERVGKADNGCASHAIESGGHLAIGDIDIDFMRTRHPVECLAMRLVGRHTGDVLVYTADGALTESLVEFSQGADLLLAECSLYPPTSGEAPGHMNANDVAELARRVNPGTLVLTHLPFYGRREDLLGCVRARWGGCACLAGELDCYGVSAADTAGEDACGEGACHGALAASKDACAGDAGNEVSAHAGERG